MKSLMIVFSIFMAASTTLAGQSTSNDISKISPVLHNDF